MFSFTKLNNHFENGVLKNHLEAKNYVEKYFRHSQMVNTRWYNAAS